MCAEKIERSLITFSGPGACVKWAEEVCLRDGLGSQLGQFVPRRGDSKDSPIRITGEDANLLAHTISCKVSHVDPHIAGKLYRYLYGPNKLGYLNDVAICLGDEISRRMVAPKTTMTTYQMVSLSLIRCKKQKLKGGRVILAKEARRLGISKQAYNDVPYINIRSTGNEIIQQWIDQAERQLTVMFNDLGIF